MRKRKRRGGGSRKAEATEQTRASVISRFKVYRPASPSVGKPNGRRFTVYQAKPATRDPEPPPVSRANRFAVYQPTLPPSMPNGSCWVEHDGYWLCQYGCKTFPVREAPQGVDNDDYHAYDCPYWWEAGIHETPF